MLPNALKQISFCVLITAFLAFPNYVFGQAQDGIVGDLAVSFIDLERKVKGKDIICKVKNSGRVRPGVIIGSSWRPLRKVKRFKRIKKNSPPRFKKINKRLKKQCRKKRNNITPAPTLGPTPTPIATPAVLNPSNTLFVDLKLDPTSGGSGDCTGNYDPATRTCAAGLGTFNAYDTLQEAADLVNPGDFVFVREGTYQNVTENCLGSGYCYLTHLKRSGTKESPITFINYKDEDIILRGFGFSDEDQDNDGRADGPVGPIDGISVDREKLFIIEADYIQLSGVTITNSTNVGLSIRGSYNLVENCKVHDTWATCIAVGFSTTEDKIVEGNVIRFVETYRSRHGSGITLGRSFPGNRDTYLNLSRNHTVESCLSYKHGYQADGEKVLPISGDPAGGGNSDAMGTTKLCSDSATLLVPNWCPGNVFKNNIGFGNADDGMDVSFADSVIEGNIMFENGPEGNRGYKVLRQVDNLTFRGNVAIENLGPGFEPRVEEGGLHYLYNNTALRNGNWGIRIGGSGIVAKNNLAANNPGNDVFGCDDCTNNSTTDDPALTDLNFEIDTNFSSAFTVAEKLAFLRNQFKQALTPTSSASALVDQGIVISGYHCSTEGPHAGENCREWYGNAPDIGAFEYVP